MPVGLQVMISENQPQPFWDKFLDAHELQDLNTEQMNEVLARWGAHTEWDSWSEPVWFPDQESLTAFVLTWS